MPTFRVYDIVLRHTVFGFRSVEGGETETLFVSGDPPQGVINTGLTSFGANATFSYSPSVAIWQDNQNPTVLGFGVVNGVPQINGWANNPFVLGGHASTVIETHTESYSEAGYYWLDAVPFAAGEGPAETGAGFSHARETVELLPMAFTWTFDGGSSTGYYFNFYGQGFMSWPEPDRDSIRNPDNRVFWTFPDYLVLSSLFTPQSDRIDIAARLADFTAADMDALAGHDRVILPGAGAWETYTFADTFHGGRGNDTVTGRDGWDNVAGDAGNDSLSGRAGLDSLYGGAGHDRLDGGADSDALYGGDQADILQGGSGVDSLWGGAGDDFLYVGQEQLAPDLRETTGGHLLDGGAGNDFLNAWGADNALHDTLTGGAGADQFQVRGGDLITDFGAEDWVLMLNGRATDWMSAVRDPEAGTVTLRFHNAALRTVADLELDGTLAPRGFYATAPSVGGYSTIRYQEPIAATRPEVLTLARALMKSLDNLQDDVLAEGFVFAQKALPGWAAKRWLTLEDTYMPELRRKLGDQAAEDLADYMNGKAGEFGQLMGEVAQGTARPKDAWDLLRDASVDVLKAVIPGDTFDLLVDLGVSGATIGAKLFERAVTLMTNSIRDDLLYQADLALQDRSLIIVREPGAGAPPAPGDLRLPAPLADDLAFL